MIAGILLAAGAGTRFGGAKLIQTIHDSTPVCVASARNLKAALSNVIAVTRPGDTAVFELLQQENDLRVLTCLRSEEGMGHTLAEGVAASPDATGWIVALGDMPLIQPATIQRVAAAIEHGASFAIPRHQGQRGHPIGIHGRFRDELLALTGDKGARDLIAAHADKIEFVDVDDPGILLDIDTRADLERVRNPSKFG